MSGNQLRRESDRAGFNGWLSKWGEPANIARLLGSFLAVVFGAFTLIIGGYAWNMKIDDRSLDTRALAIANQRSIEKLSEKMLQSLKTVQTKLAEINQNQVLMSQQIDHILDNGKLQRQSLLRHQGQSAHNGQARETARTNANLSNISERVKDLDSRVRQIERDGGHSGRD